MSRIHDIPTALRSLDPADHHVDPASARARADLQRILAADPLPSSTLQPRRRARTTRSLALSAGLAVAVAAGVVVLPSFLGGDQAFASWTAAPHGMTDEERTDAAAGCRRSQQDGAGAEHAEALSSSTAVLAERRGVWTTVVLAGPGGFSALCITDDSTHLFGKDMIGSVGTPTGYVTPGPRDLIATDLGTATMDAGDISLAAGAAGSDVAAVVYRSRTHGDVAATVSQGRFALWLPGDELRDAAAADGVEVEVTYRNGSTGTIRLTL
jgi:hypothetical protein